MHHEFAKDRCYLLAMSILRDAARAFMPYPDAPVAHAESGPLIGLTFADKDLYDVAGYPTSGGQPFVLAMSGIKTTTAPTVQRLLDAGARFVAASVHVQGLGVGSVHRRDQ